MTGSTITLLVHCIHCGRPVTLHFRDRHTLPNIETIWTCPYLDCPTLEGQRIGFPGELLDLWIGHGAPPDADDLVH